MTMKDEDPDCQARLLLTSEEQYSKKFDELLQRFEGSACWRKGEKIGKTLIRHKENGWQIFSKKASTVREALDELKDKVGNSVSELREIADAEMLEVDLAIYITARTWLFPEISFEKEDLAWCTALDCRIDVDVMKSLPRRRAGEKAS